MATIQEQYVELIKQGQDVGLAAIESWTQAFQQMFGQVPSAGIARPEQVIDQVYDFAGHMLDAQRDFSKQIVSSSTAAAEKVRSGVEQTAEAASSYQN